MLIVPGVFITWMGVGYLLSNIFPWVYKEIGRIPSPDAKYEAIVLRGN